MKRVLVIFFLLAVSASLAFAGGGTQGGDTASGALTLQFASLQSGAVEQD
jgi:hypothetical protein